MASAAIAPDDAGNRRRAGFVVTICVGSFLLFLVQPMIARMALPRLGGAPAVWTSAMLVYQALLLGGYGYAHWLGRFGGRVQGRVHLAAFAIAALTLPIGLGAATPPPGADPLLWTPWLLVTSIGPLFFVVSAQAPIVQRWYALSQGADPYPLYAASNLGSFAGLIAYPLIVEPLLDIESQRLVWSAGYLALFALVAVTALSLPKRASRDREVERGPAPTARQMRVWIVYAAVPSALMLSTSLHLTTDIVAMPLLWVLPLGLYLLSFSVAFSANRSAAEAVTRVSPIALLMGACSVFIDEVSAPMTIAVVALATLFVVAVALHAAMFDRRPDAGHLTHFYLACSIGGVAGGLFCGLIAPLLFNWTYEHPIGMIAAALLLTPRSIFAATDRRRSGRAVRFGIIGLILLSLGGQGPFGLSSSNLIAGGFAVVIIVIGLTVSGNRLLFATAVGALMMTLGGWNKAGLSLNHGLTVRSFFGVYSIRETPTARLLVHGTTVHGIQRKGSAADAIAPTSYYAPKSGIGMAMRAVPSLFGDAPHVGVVGLGAGTLACYARPGQSWRFYEIDPAMAEIARDPARFTFLSRCLPGVPIVIGDARRRARRPVPAAGDRRLFVGCGADASADEGSVRPLPVAARARRTADGAHLEPLYRP